jgi:NADH/NAD ratio-sensing transcriptional regulator Rex
MANISSPIPEKTIERLSEYRRTLVKCHAQGITHIFSHVLAGMHGITAVQVRRDLMLIGFSSDTKKGYDVKVLIDFIDGILYSEQPINMAVIGMGHLGRAVTRYSMARASSFASPQPSMSTRIRWEHQSTVFPATISTSLQIVLPSSISAS